MYSRAAKHTGICRSFNKQGGCPQGADCPNKHIEWGKLTLIERRSVQLCHHYASPAGCPRGKLCHYQHRKPKQLEGKAADSWQEKSKSEAQKGQLIFKQESSSHTVGQDSCKSSPSMPKTRAASREAPSVSARSQDRTDFKVDVSEKGSAQAPTRTEQPQVAESARADECEGKELKDMHRVIGEGTPERIGVSAGREDLAREGADKAEAQGQQLHPERADGKSLEGKTDDSGAEVAAPEYARSGQERAAPADKGKGSEGPPPPLVAGSQSTLSAGMLEEGWKAWQESLARKLPQGPPKVQHSEQTAPDVELVQTKGGEADAEKPQGLSDGLGPKAEEVAGEEEVGVGGQGAQRDVAGVGAMAVEDGDWEKEEGGRKEWDMRREGDSVKEEDGRKEGDGQGAEGKACVQDGVRSSCARVDAKDWDREKARKRAKLFRIAAEEAARAANQRTGEEMAGLNNETFFRETAAEREHLEEVGRAQKGGIAFGNGQRIIKLEGEGRGMKRKAPAALKMHSPFGPLQPPGGKSQRPVKKQKGSEGVKQDALFGSPARRMFSAVPETQPGVAPASQQPSPSRGWLRVKDWIEAKSVRPLEVCLTEPGFEGLGEADLSEWSESLPLEAFLPIKPVVSKGGAAELAENDVTLSLGRPHGRKDMRGAGLSLQLGGDEESERLLTLQLAAGPEREGSNALGKGSEALREQGGQRLQGPARLKEAVSHTPESVCGPGQDKELQFELLTTDARPKTGQVMAAEWAEAQDRALGLGAVCRLAEEGREGEEYSLGGVVEQDKDAGARSLLAAKSSLQPGLEHGSAGGVRGALQRGEEEKGRLVQQRGDTARASEGPLCGEEDAGAFLHFASGLTPEGVTAVRSAEHEMEKGPAQLKEPVAGGVRLFGATICMRPTDGLTSSEPAKGEQKDIEGVRLFGQEISLRAEAAVFGMGIQRSESHQGESRVGSQVFDTKQLASKEGGPCKVVEGSEGLLEMSRRLAEKTSDLTQLATEEMEGLVGAEQPEQLSLTAGAQRNGDRQQAGVAEEEGMKRLEPSKEGQPLAPEGLLVESESKGRGREEIGGGKLTSTASSKESRPSEVLGRKAKSDLVASVSSLDANESQKKEGQAVGAADGMGKGIPGPRPRPKLNPVPVYRAKAPKVLSCQRSRGPSWRMLPPQGAAYAGIMSHILHWKYDVFSK
jgi:hypothetical protein